MLKFLSRNRARAAALVVAAGIVSAASAVSLITGLTIMAPSEIVAGNNINGYATGMSGCCVVNGGCSGGFGALGPVVRGFVDPLFFSYPTSEPMAPGLATIHAVDSDETANASVILK